MKTSKRTKSKHQARPRSTDHIDSFFAEYSTFEYDPSAPVWTEFNRMCNVFGWDAEDYEMREARRNFKSAIVQQFNGLYGTNIDDLNAWQELCHILDIEPVPESLEGCREVSGRLVENTLSRDYLCKAGADNNSEFVRHTLIL
jgi:hypothetical protein